MKMITCDSCGGAGRVVVDDAEAPCDAEIVLGHEAIGCFATRQHPGQPHMAILCVPCFACGGYDEHHESCAVYDMEPHSQPPSSWWFWHDDDLSLSLAAAGVGKAWRNEYQRRAA